MARFTAAILLAIIAGIILAPSATFLVFCIWAIISLVLNTALKAAAAIATLRASRPDVAVFSTRRNGQPDMRLPMVSIMVPLFREREIAGRLVRRLNHLNYPRELLDICLVVEEDDLVTQAALDAASLPNRSEEHTSELQSRRKLVCRLLLEKQKKYNEKKIK